jgi:hypothetical protein
VHAGSANDWWEVAITIASAMASWAVLTVIEPPGFEYCPATLMRSIQFPRSAALRSEFAKVGCKPASSRADEVIK